MGLPASLCEHTLNLAGQWRGGIGMSNAIMDNCNSDCSSCEVLAAARFPGFNFDLPLVLAFEFGLAFVFVFVFVFALGAALVPVLVFGFVVALRFAFVFAADFTGSAAATCSSLKASARHCWYRAGSGSISRQERKLMVMRPTALNTP